MTSLPSAALRRDTAGLLADRRLVAFLLGAVPITALGAANGGYYAGSWGWGSLLFLWVAGLALALERDAPLGALGIAFVGFAIALAVWTAASALWSSDLTATGLATQRELLYAAVAVGGVAVVRRSSVAALLAGVWCAIVLLCGYGLLTRLLPDRMGVVDVVGGYRLSGPIGYWNSFGLLAVLGIVLALGFVARARSVVLRALAAASLPVLVSALYFTFSRGAWVSLALATVVLVALDRARLQLLLAAGVAGWAAAVAAVLSGTKPPLTTIGYPLPAEAHAGAHLLVELAVLAAAAAGCTVALAALEWRIAVPDRARTAAAAVLVAAAVAALAAFTVRFGAPWTAVRSAWHSFVSSPVDGSNLNGRLLSLSSNGRIAQWRDAWAQVRAHPVLGGGAGTWVDYWVRHRPRALTVHNVHNLYLETFAELGPVGVVLVAGVLLLPFAGVRGLRREPLTSTAAAALAAFDAHAAVDWDWQLAAVTLPALLCATALVAENGSALRALGGVARGAGIALVAVLLAAGVYATVGRVELAKISSAGDAGRTASAQRLARRASRLEPWSSEPWQRLGASVVAADPSLAQRAYRKATKREPSSWQLWIDLAQVSRGAAQDEALHRAHALNPLGVPAS